MVKSSKSASLVLPEEWAVAKTPTSWVAVAAGTAALPTRFQAAPSVEQQPGQVVPLGE